jgi:hypothetical protein
MTNDGEMLARVLHSPGFLSRLLLEDCADDWELARELGDFLTRVAPDLALGFTIQVRANRHLGATNRALEALERASALIVRDAHEQDLADILLQERRAAS